jgi:hypothetical protein
MTSIPNHLQEAEKTNGSKASAIKSRKNTKAPQKKPPSHKSTIEKTTRAQSSNPVQPLKQKKPPSHKSKTEKSLRAQSSNPVQPPKQKKPTTIKEMVEPISKRKLAWKALEEEGKMTIGAQHVLEFLNNLNT